MIRLATARIPAILFALLFVRLPAEAVGAQGSDGGSAAPSAKASSASDAGVDVPARNEQDRWWNNVRALCGQAFEGSITHGETPDDPFAGKRLVMHVRECGDMEMKIPFHVGEDRSRTWVLTRTAKGIELEHDHRHEDGSSDVLTMYGGDTDAVGLATVQNFPADAYSKALFDAHGIPQSKPNVWSMELQCGKRFSYILRRPGRHFQVDFDLTKTVEPPPAPWGHD